MTTTHLFWYLARSAGFLAYLFAWGSVTLGLLMTTRLAQRIDRATQYILHRLLGLGSVVFLGLHLVTLFLDPWANFSVADLFVPFHASYRPFWMGCGILAAYLLGGDRGDFNLPAAAAESNLAWHPLPLVPDLLHRPRPWHRQWHRWRAALGDGRSTPLGHGRRRALPAPRPLGAEGSNANDGPAAQRTAEPRARTPAVTSPRGADRAAQRTANDPNVCMLIETTPISRDGNEAV